MVYGYVTMSYTNAEKQARWRERQKDRNNAADDELAQARARIAELENAAQPEQQPGPDEPNPLKNFRTRAEFDAYKAGVKTGKRLAKPQQQPQPKPPKPPLDPESEAARQIKALKTRNTNLRSELAHLKRWYDNQLLRNGKMPLGTHRAIIKCLHPDTRRQITDEDYERACRLFNDFAESANRGRAK